MVGAAHTHQSDAREEVSAHLVPEVLCSCSKVTNTTAYPQPASGGEVTSAFCAPCHTGGGVSTQQGGRVVLLLL